MIGNFRPKSCKMTANAKDNYFNLYCSLCKTLRKSFGMKGMFLINNELTTMLLSLREYYVPEERITACPAALFLIRKKIIVHRIINKASEFSFLLGWLKIIDNVSDKPSNVTNLLKKIMTPTANKLLNQIGEDFRLFFNEYIELTIKKSTDFHYIREMSGNLAENLFGVLAKESNINKYHELKLGKIFSLFGEIISIADPLIDIEEDIRTAQYNPILDSVKANNTDVMTEYDFLKSEYEKTEKNLRIELHDAEKENISNRVFFIVMDLGLNELNRKIIYAKDRTFQPKSKLNNIVNIGKNYKRFPMKRYFYAGCCCEDCCEFCCEFIRDCCCCGCGLCDPNCE